MIFGHIVVYRQSEAVAVSDSTAMKMGGEIISHILSERGLHMERICPYLNLDPLIVHQIPDFIPPVDKNTKGLV